MNSHSMGWRRLVRSMIFFLSSLSTSALMPLSKCQNLMSQPKLRHQPLLDVILGFNFINDLSNWFNVSFFAFFRTECVPLSLSFFSILQLVINRHSQPTALTKNAQLRRDLDQLHARNVSCVCHTGLCKYTDVNIHPARLVNMHFSLEKYNGLSRCSFSYCNESNINYTLHQYKFYIVFPRNLVSNKTHHGMAHVYTYTHY